MAQQRPGWGCVWAPVIGSGRGTKAKGRELLREQQAALSHLLSLPGRQEGICAPAGWGLPGAVRKSERAAGMEATPPHAPLRPQSKQLGAEGFYGQRILRSEVKYRGPRRPLAPEEESLVKAGGRPILKASELSPLPALFKSTPVSIPKVLLTGRLAEVNRLPGGKEEAS